MKLVAYTVIMGNYDVLVPTKYPSMCLTDDEMKTVKGWTVRCVSPMHKDARRASRHPKMMPHLYFPDADFTLYIDGNIRLLRSPQTILSHLLLRHDMALFQHPQRTCIYAEAGACIKRKKADPTLIKQQIAAYRREKMPAGFGLTACYVILRRNTPETRLFGEMWWNEYLRFTDRDQLSFDYVRWKMEMKYDPIPGDLLVNDSRYFRRIRHSGLAKGTRKRAARR